jgi:murein L,D-transpeptidase YcbB/YkuD
MGTIRITGLFMAMTLIFTCPEASGNDSIAPKKAGIVAWLPAYEKLEKAVEQYHQIQKEGGWRPIKADKKFYMKGQSGPAVKALKQRLKITGEFDAEDSSLLFTPALVEAVKKVQHCFGFTQNGVVDARLIKVLNVPVEERIQQLMANLERLQNAPPVKEGTRLVANIPEYRLYVYEGEQPQFDMDIVVGSETNQTVLFTDEITHVVFSPYWNVPQSIVANEILPAMEKDPGYLRKNGYEETGYENGLPVIRQKPGPKNSLGGVKFIFPNDHNIYFHDTPVKGLFRLPKRAFSHGCIRLAEPAKLALYLLRNSPGWTAEKIKKAMNAGREQWIELPVPVAVSLTYFTAWVDGEGMLHLREDVYGLDKVTGGLVQK